ncbi:MAG TPA: DUF309 domain-containing protein [Terriglobales bacterium]|nr:DUF309 domain-containing protein [Terriglobales bacterium]
MDSHSFLRGLHLFNESDFFEAHEVWEDVWRAAPAEEKKFLQGLIQLAVGLHHHSTGNRAGAQSLLARGARNLSHYPKDFGGVDLCSLLEEVAGCRQALADGSPISTLPRIKTLKC